MNTNGTGARKSLVGVVALAMATPILMLIFVGASVSIQSACGTGATGLSGLNAGVGARATGRLTFAQANIPTRSGSGGFKASMPRVLSHAPDFVTLNEQFARSLGTIQAAAPGYTAYRDLQRGHDPGSEETFDTVVAWKSDTWTQVDGGRVKLVEDGKEPSKGGVVLRGWTTAVGSSRVLPK